MRWGMIGFLVVFSARAGLAHTPVPHDLRELNEKIRHNPSDVALLLERSGLNRTLRRYDDALFDLELTLALSPEHNEVPLHRGRIYLAMGRYALAEYHLTRYIQNVAKDYDAHWLRGRSRERLGRLELALLDYRGALSIKPSVSAFLAKARVEKDLGRPQDASKTLRQGLQTMDGAAVLRAELINVAIASGNADEAIAEIEPLLLKARVKTRWLLLRAQAHELKGAQSLAQVDREAALVQAERMVKRRASPASLVGRAHVLVALGREAEAERDVDRALARAPRFDDARKLSALLRALRTSGGKK